MKFEQLQTMYNLPSLEFLKSEFEIKEDEDNLVRHIRKKVAGLLDSYISLLEEVIHPDASSPRVMHESNHFTPEKRQELTKLYKKLMFLYRIATRASVSRKESDDVDFITKTLHDWEDIKTQMLGIVRVLEKSWNGSAETHEEVAYLG